MKKIILSLLISLPCFTFAQELDRSGYKFAEKAFDAFIVADKEKLTKLYFTLEKHNELLATQDITEIEQEKHNEKVERLVNRSLDNRKKAGEVDWKSMSLEKIVISDSNDEEGLIFFTLAATGWDDQDKKYTVTFNEAIQFYDRKYYLSKDINLIIE